MGPGAVGGSGGYGGAGAKRAAPSGWVFNDQSDGISYLVSQPHQRKEVNIAFHNIGEWNTAFEDKVAVSAMGQYSDTDSQGWIRTTSNYLASKAYEMAHFLPWAESAQAHQITHAHVNALGDCGAMGSVEPLQLSRDLWGYLNLALIGKQRMTFNSSPQGSGFEAWRRLVVPMAPRRSSPRILQMRGRQDVR